MTYLQSVLLGVLQGLTEFLPISSSAHLAIAVAWVRALFRSEHRSDPDARLGWYIIIGTVPIAVAGVLLQDTIKTAFRSLGLIAAMLIVFGLILGIADRVGAGRKVQDDLTVKDAVLFGLAQMLALIPGVSRSGATISAGLFLGYRRDIATRVAFLLAIPAVLASGIFELKDATFVDQPGLLGKAIVASVVGFVVGYLVIGWLLRYLRTRTYLPFVIYRVALGSLVLVLLALGVLNPTVGT